MLIDVKSPMNKITKGAAIFLAYFEVLMPTWLHSMLESYMNRKPFV